MNRPEAEKPLDLPPIFVDRALDSPIVLSLLSHCEQHRSGLGISQGSWRSTHTMTFLPRIRPMKHGSAIADKTDGLYLQRIERSDIDKWRDKLFKHITHGFLIWQRARI